MAIAGAVTMMAVAAGCAGPGYAGGGCPAGVTIHNGTPASVPASGWYKADTRAQGWVDVSRATPPPPGFGCGSVHLTTGGTLGDDKAQLISYELAGTPLAAIDQLSYLAYKSSLSDPAHPAVDVSIEVEVTGPSVPDGSATLIYEPYWQSGTQAAIQLNTWQTWNATATTAGDGRWWTHADLPGTTGDPNNPAPWSYFQGLWDDATLKSYGFNVGSWNPNSDLRADGLTIGSTSLDFLVTTNF